MSKKILQHPNILPHSLSAISNQLNNSSASFTQLFEQKKLKDDPSQYKIKVKKVLKNQSQRLNNQIRTQNFQRNRDQYITQDEQQQQPHIQAQQIPLKQNLTGYQICKHSFSQEEIIQAFKVIDINKDQIITEEDIMFFLEYIKQPYTKEEVTEMIQMVSSDKKKVTYQDFKKLGKGLIIPFADIKIPDDNIRQKRKIYQNIQNNSSLYNQNPSLLVNASKSDIISVKKFEQSKKVLKTGQFQSIKLIEQQQQFNFLQQKISLLTQQQFLIRKQQFNLIQMVNINQIIKNYNQRYIKKQNKQSIKFIDHKDIAKILEISQKQAKILYAEENNILPKKVILQAIAFSPLYKIKKLQLGMMIMLNKKTINFNQLYFLLQLMKGKDQSQSLRKKLSTVFKNKKITYQEEIDKLYALQLINTFNQKFNF